MQQERRYSDYILEGAGQRGDGFRVTIYIRTIPHASLTSKPGSPDMPASPGLPSAPRMPCNSGDTTISAVINVNPIWLLLVEAEMKCAGMFIKVNMTVKSFLNDNVMYVM